MVLEEGAWNLKFTCQFIIEIYQVNSVRVQYKMPDIALIRWTHPILQKRCLENVACKPSRQWEVLQNAMKNSESNNQSSISDKIKWDLHAH